MLSNSILLSKQENDMNRGLGHVQSSFYYVAHSKIDRRLDIPVFDGRNINIKGNLSLLLQKMLVSPKITYPHAYIYDHWSRYISLILNIFEEL